jgi:hypothetical protein
MILCLAVYFNTRSILDHELGQSEIVQTSVTSFMDDPKSLNGAHTFFLIANRCEATFTTKCSMQRHIDVTHNKLKCLQCHQVIRSNSNNTVCFRDLGKLNMPMVVDFKLEPIFDTAPAASKK